MGDLAESVPRIRLPGALLLGLLFLFLFGPKVGPIDVLSTACLVAIVIYWLYHPYLPALTRRFWLPLVLLILLLIYSTAIVLFSQTTELFYPLRFARVIFNYLGVYAISYLYWRKYQCKFLQVITSHLFWAVAIHAAIMGLQYSSPGFRSFTYAWVGYIDGQAIRVPGLTASIGVTSMVHGAAVLLAPRVFTQVTGSWRVVFYIGFLLVLWSLTVMGRTGFYLTLGFFFLQLVIGQKKVSKTVMFLLGTMGVLALAFVVGGELISQSVVTRYLDGSIGHLLEPWKQYQQVGGFRSATIDALRSMYFLPEDTATLLFGNGASGRGILYISSDVGYVLNIFGIGVVGLGIVVAFYLLALRWAIRLATVDRGMGVASFLFNLGILAYHFKEQTALTRYSFTVTALFLCCSLFVNRSGIHPEFS